ncbi:MAG: hypothetical protein JWP89_3970 [Schlesneria sp.]|nr:hypothetical protein [Schlesneria sp.]
MRTIVNWCVAHRLMVILFVVIALVAGFVFTQARSDPDGVSQKDLERAKESFKLKYGRDANRVDALSWLAESYLSRGRAVDAIQCFSKIPTTHPVYGHMARYQQARALLGLHRAVEAEAEFRDLIGVEDQHPEIQAKYLIDARQRLRHILEVELRFEERQQLLRGTISRGEGDFFEVVAYCFPSHLRWNGPEAMQWIDEFHGADADNHWIKTALGRYRTGQGQLAEARKLLEEVVHDRPTDRWAIAALIACLREMDDQDELSRRFNALPSLAADDPWLLLIQRGQIANEQGRPQDAVAAFELLLKHDSTSSEAWAGLTKSYLELGDLPRRKRALAKSSVLGRLQNNLGKIFRKPEDPDSYLFVLDLCAEIDLIDEGQILSQFVGRLAPDNPKVIAAVELFRQRAATPNSSSVLE